MASEIIFIVRESLEGGYEAEALGHAIFTEAETLEELREMVIDAVKCHFDEHERPKIVRLAGSCEVFGVGQVGTGSPTVGTVRLKKSQL